MFKYHIYILSTTARCCCSGSAVSEQSALAIKAPVVRRPCRHGERARNMEQAVGDREPPAF